MSDKKEEIRYEDGAKVLDEKAMTPFFDSLDKESDGRLFKENYSMLYELVFKLCQKRDVPPQLYNLYTSSIQNYLRNKIVPLLTDLKSKSFESDFLKQWDKRWKNHKLVVKGFSILFDYLDRYYTKEGKGVLNLTLQGFKIYKDEVFDKFVDYARVCLLNAINRERELEEQDRYTLSQCSLVFVEIGHNCITDAGRDKVEIYKNELSRDIVTAASSYYQIKSRTWVEQDSCPVYLRKAESNLEQEKKRVESYLHASTLEPLVQACYTELLHNHQKEILSKSTGFDELLFSQNLDDLARLYRLFSLKQDDLPPIAEMFQKYISKEGTTVVETHSRKGKEEKESKEEKEDDKEGDGAHNFVKKLIDLHEKYAVMVRDCFQNHHIFQKSLKTAFEVFINMDDRVSKLLAKYVNDVLQKFTKVRPQDLESTLENIVFLYGYLTDKDVFERDYQTFLAQRLLLDLCESEYSEKAMIAKLKTQCGYQWTNKLEGMFKDIQKSKDLMIKFKKFYDTEKQHGLQLDVNVCTTSYWPSSKLIQCRMPTDIEMPCEKYKTYYLSQHSGHKLTWRMDQGQAEVLVNFPKGPKILVCSSYQMMVLLAFNAASVLTYQQILEQTGIPPFEIINHLLSLAHPKIGILDKLPKTKELSEDHKFRLNPEYTNTLRKVQLRLVVNVENPTAVNAEEEAIKLQRRHQTDAAIVRIMKTRKTLPHNQLIAEVVQQLRARFKPEAMTIKKRIDALIDQEYLKRDDDDRSKYHYLA